MDFCSIRPRHGLGGTSVRDASRQSRRTYPVNTSGDRLGIVLNIHDLGVN
jgi:hypothetical protein